MKTILFLVFNISQVRVVTDDLDLDPNIFITIFAGVILALAFQFVLTAVSVAAGVSAIGNIKKNFVKNRVEPNDSNIEEEYEFDQNFSSGTSTGVKITSAFGIWSIVTTCLALFSATMLALHLNVIESVWVNITTSLVIWGLFFLILFYLEAKIARTLIGNLISAATSGLRNSANMIGTMLAPSPESKIENVVGNTIDRIRKEFDSGLNTDKLSEVLNNFLSKVDNKIPDYENLKNDLENIAKKSSNKNTAGKWMAIQQVLTKLISENSNSNNPERKGKAKKLQEILDTVISKYKASPGMTEGVKNVVEEFTSLERQEIDQRTQDLENYLKSATSSDLSLDSIQSKFKKVFNNPSLVTAVISNNFKDFDRSKIIEILNKNTNLQKEDLEQYSDRIDSTMQTVAKEFDKENEDRLVKRIEKQVANFFNATGKDELDYSLLKKDVNRILDNPKDSLAIIKKRFSTFDTGTLRAIVTNNKYIKEEHIDKVIETIDSSKKDVMAKVSQIETTANQQISIAKRKAVIQAEHARATAASAAWWLVLTILFSGIAAAAGGLLPL